MTPRRVLRAVLAVALVASAGCTAWNTREVEATRAGLVGLSGLELRKCLGVPTDFNVDGDVETQGYHFELDDDEAGFEAGRLDADLGGMQLPGGRGYEPRGFPFDDGPPPYCQLDFELVKGKVTQVSAQGRTREGLNADTTCLLRAQACVPQADEGERAE